jgi:aspartate 1-decarboxylase
MIRSLLKSKIHRCVVTEANANYEGSITIAEDLMLAVDLWEGEKVLVSSVTSGSRIETYVQKGPAGSGVIIINGGAANLIRRGEILSIMCFTQSATPIVPKRVVCDSQNNIIRR